MKKYNIDHPILISYALDVFPPYLRSAIISDLKFCKIHGITTDAKVSFGNSEAVFSRSKLFKSIREIFNLSSLQCILIDENSIEWCISISPDDKSVICIENKNIKLQSNIFWPLINDLKLRISIFKNEAEKRNLSKDDITKWLLALSNEQLDDEVGEVNTDLELTPSYIAEKLKLELADESNKISTIVPESIIYYERLIGKYTSSIDINEYSANELKEHFNGRVKKEISYFDLLLCSQQSISQAVAEHIPNDEKFKSLAKEAINSQNPIFIIGCIEIGVLNYLESNETVLKELFEYLCTPQIMASFTFLCSMTIFIDGELARLKIFKNKPPFYRRLASFTQASLVTKIALEQGNEFKDIEKWAMEERGLFFYCQTFIDLRNEPKWLPSYLTPGQLRDELLGRLQIVSQKVLGSELCQHILQDLTSKSLIHLNAFLPGPLEGNIESSEIPDYILEILDTAMDEQASLKAFTTLINSAPFWKVDGKYVDHAVMLLENAQHQLKETNDKESIYLVLNGLAIVAASARSKKLSASVMILSRRYRDYLNVNAEPENILGMGLVASAAYKDINEWAEYIGQWVNELAHLPLAPEALASLKSMLEQLCILEPYLYYTCGRPLEILRCLED